MSFIGKSNELTFNKHTVGPEASGKHRGAFIQCLMGTKDKKKKFDDEFKLTLGFENICPDDSHSSQDLNELSQVQKESLGPEVINKWTENDTNNF